MLSKSFVASIFLLALTSSVNANAVITPLLGVQSTPGASDVQQPSDGKPCGNIPISQNIDTSQTCQADSTGEFKPSIINFNTDGSRSIKTVKVDASGAGSNFVDAQVIDNGDTKPGSDGTQQLTVKLPDGIKCAGGSSKNRCLASFVTTEGYGNCVVVTQAGSNAKRSAPEDENKPKPSGEPRPSAKPQPYKDAGNVQPSPVKSDQPSPSQVPHGDKPKNKRRMIMKRRL